MSSQQKSFIL
jgi:hypothetical protein